MKRSNPHVDQTLNFEGHKDISGPPMKRQVPAHGLPTPLSESSRPSKVRRHGSKILSILRSLTKSASSHSNPEGSPVIPSTSSIKPEITLKESRSMLRITPIQPTVVNHVQASQEHDTKSVVEVAVETSPSTSGSGNSGKSSMPRNDSTGMTSLESKLSLNAAQQSSENKKTGVSKPVVVEDQIATEVALEPIQEVSRELAPTPVPTVLTVEKAAATKIFLECFYNELFSPGATPRSLRRRDLEKTLYEDKISSATEKEAKRDAWNRQETDHLREIRNMKSRTAKIVRGRADMASQYEVVKVLGKGSFGVVRLVREVADPTTPDSLQKREVFAMKVIRKSDMLRNSQEGHLRAERDVLVASERSRWIVPLIASFQDASNLYLVMEYMPGGDFLGLLIRDNVLSEAVTRFYIAEMVLCIEEAHSLRWIHRDVKPDNFLISASGHLKISDFGLAFDGHWSHDQAYYNNQRYSLLTKLGINIEGDSIDRKEGRNMVAAMKAAQSRAQISNRHDVPEGEPRLLNWRNRKGNRTYARSVVGTSQYMAPEVIRGDPYDARCDWWSVAIVLYECLYGHTPFLAEEGGRAQTKINIQNHKTTFAFPPKPAVSSRCQDLIRRMIKEKPERLCSPRYRAKDTGNVPGVYRDYTGRYVYPNDAEEIKSHRWFKDVQWDKLHLMTPPFVPLIRSVEDTHYFDEEEPISDFSMSADDDAHVRLEPPTEVEVDEALRGFNREITILARGYVASAYDSVRLRRIEREIDGFIMGDEQKEYLKHFVKAYGRKERKRPRDKLLRDKEVAPVVLEIRKRGAFLGYSYRRIRARRVLGGSASSSGGSAGWRANVAANRRPAVGNVWHRGRLSMH